MARPGATHEAAAHGRRLRIRRRLPDVSSIKRYNKVSGAACSSELK